jgi:DNA-binding transcriptional regulator GbsR (MarR family)
VQVKEKSTEPLEPGRKRFIDKLGLYYENYGIPRIGGRIIGLILTAEAPVSAEEIVGALAVSRSSVSTNIRLLQMAGFLEVSPGQAGRADCFTLSGDAWLNAITARIEGFKYLKVIAVQGLSNPGAGESASKKVQEMADWADAMIEGHMHIKSQWMKRGEIKND